MQDSKGGHKYTTLTFYEHLVAQYSGLNLIQVQELDYIDYLVLRRDAFINMLSQSEEGRKYLDNAYRLEQTEPDRRSLREKFNKKED